MLLLAVLLWVWGEECPFPVKEERTCIFWVKKEGG